MDFQEKTGLPHTQDVPAFLEGLRRLKEESGLTLRQLEQRAAAKGELLPRSTLSSMLSGRRLPRPELLATFIRACGHEERVDAWLAARDTLAAGLRSEEDPAETAPAPAGPAPAPAPAPAPDGPNPTAAGPGPVPAAPVPDTDTEGRGTHASRSRPYRRLLRPRLLVPLAVVALVGATAGVLGTRSEDPGPGPATAADAARESSGQTTTRTAREKGEIPRGAIRLHPLSADRLCLTDGHVRDGRYHSQVAVQRPCDEAPPQKTELRREPGSDGYRIQWHHPEFGTGCLKVLDSGPGKGLLEPWDACDRAELFQVVPAPGRGVVTLRTEGGRCVGMAEPVTAERTEAVAQRCTTGRHQLFRVEPAD
ncbi:helix-turn-helix domain-containing protein [Streptomyces albus]|uniref:helix-turn-helix domain-containing protein n=1 Tax=Streptomyces sp. NRRL F-5917 TaxID=1463873 RepID=UPI0004BFB70D|nr:helix-turn-helix transcriptional regulator [Streptomyces sp. NRRL F-5917]